MKDYKDLLVWQQAIDLVEDVYSLTKQLPKEEMFGLTDQIKRSVVSVPSNISEGACRGTDKEFIRFLFIALGSAAEVETQLIIAKRLGYISEIDNVCEDITTLRKMLHSLIKSIRD